MKKITLTTLLLFTISCGYHNVNLTEEEYRAYKISKKDKEYLGVDGEMLEIHYGTDGHEYVKQKTYGFNYTYTHNVECLKCKNGEN